MFKKFLVTTICSCAISASIGGHYGYSVAATQGNQKCAMLAQEQSKVLERKEGEILRLRQSINTASRGVVARHTLSTFRVTAYAPYDNVNGIQNDGTADTTATGTRPAPGTIAVDPRVIPYGSTVIVVYANGKIETGIAEDCGGAVKGNHIDIYRETYTEAIEFGSKKATVLWFKEEK